MRNVVSLATATIVTTTIAGIPFLPVYAEDGDPAWATCTQQNVPVTMSEADQTVYVISGRLCLRDESLRGDRTVELMVSGFTYDHNYFNIPYEPNTYSYVYAATSNGYSTFNIDRLGVGLSGKPPTEQLTVQTHAYTVAQIVRKLRSGAVGGRAFTNVVGVGHSLGAGIFQYLAGSATDPRDVPDYLVLSGWLHRGNPPMLTTLGNSVHEANLDPAFSSAGLPAGYVTTLPGVRGVLFYNTLASEAAMIDLDEALKQTGTVPERLTLAAVRASTITLNIQVPVLLSVGQKDTLQCDEAVAGMSCASAAAMLAREWSLYSARACLTAYAVIDAGHSVNLHTNARESYNYAHTWLDRYTVNEVNDKDANGCLPAQ